MIFRQAPSLEETLQGLDAAYAQLQNIAKDNTVAFERDLRRLKFGCKITRFLYLMCLATIGEGGEETISQLRQLAAVLEKDTESMQGYDSGKFFETAMAASWVAETYYTRFAAEKNADVQGNLML